MVSEKVVGTDVNEKFLAFINEQIEELLNSGKRLADTSDVKKIDDEKFILNEDVEKYDLLNELSNYLGFKTAEEPEDVYRINMPADTKLKSEGIEWPIDFIYIPIKDAEKISAKAEKIEKLLGIKLPQEIYQIKHKSLLLPNHDYEAPYPRLASETDEAYEARLAEHYAKDDTKAETIEGKPWRKPYTHERIDYKTNPNEESKDVTNAYYQVTDIEKAKAPIKPKEGGEKSKKAGDGKLTIKSSDLASPKLKKTLGERLNELGGVFSSATGWRRLKYLVVGGTAVGGFALLSSISTPLVAGLGIFAAMGGGYYLVKKNIVPKLAAKTMDFLYGKRIEEESPEGADEPEEELEETPEAELEEELSETPLTYEGFMSELGQGIKDIQMLQTAIAQIENDIYQVIDNVKLDFVSANGKEPTDEEMLEKLHASTEYNELKNKLTTRKAQLKSLLKQTYKLLEHNIDAHTLSEEGKGMGGK